MQSATHAPTFDYGITESIEQSIDEKRLQLAMEAAGFDLWEHDLITGAVTRKARKIFAELGYDDTEAASYPDDLLAIIHPDDIAMVKAALDEHLSGVTAQYCCEFRVCAKDGAWFWYANHGKIMDGAGEQRGHRFIGVTFRIDERKRKEAEREVLNRALTLLSECSTILIHAGDEQVFLDAICKLAVKTGGYLMAWVGYPENDEAKSVSVRACSGYEEGYLESVRVTWSDDATGQGPAGTAIKTGLTVVNHDYLTNDNMAPWREAARTRGYRASTSLPLIISGRVFGIFSVYTAELHSFSQAEVTLLEELASNLSYGIETIRTREENAQAQIALKKENEKNLALLRNASDGIHILDPHGNVIEASDSFCAMLGYQREEMIGMNLCQWNSASSESDLKKMLMQQLSQRTLLQFETRHRRKDGSIIDVEVSGNSLTLDGKPVVFNSSRDITARREAETSLREKQLQLIESETQYRELIRNLRTAIIVHAPDTRIIFSNPRASELLGLSENQMRGKIAIDPAFRFVNEQQKVMQPHQYPINKVIATSRPLEGQVLGVQSANKTGVIWLLVNAFPEFDAEGKLKQVVVNFDDITARKEAEEKIHTMAFFDALTGLPNRRLLMDRFQSAMSASARSGQFGAVLFIDIDKFKTVNDVRGHDFGDLLLAEMATRIQSCVGAVDTVARLGGDEFVVLLVQIDAHVESASQKAALTTEHIRAALTMPYHIKGNEQHSSPSIGVSLYRGNEDCPDVLLRQADIAMYKAKDAGRNTVRFFNPAMQLAVETHAALEADLRHAIADQQLHLYYQIQVDSDQRALGAEALVRWIHPQRGIVSPMQFIPIAEESSLILDVGGWVLDMACRQLATWTGVEKTRYLTMAVNVSAQQFKQADFVEIVAATLKRHDVEASRLKLELTESVVLSDVNDVVIKMYALKALGVKLSMDDFGTGYSSLAYLKQLPLDQIKIDQSFVRDITTDPNDAVMVKTIIDLAMNFQLHVIAEGVETESQLSFLQRHGCMAYQGFLFSRPVPKEAFEALLSQDRSVA